MRQAAWRLLCPRRWRSVGGASPGGRVRAGGGAAEGADLLDVGGESTRPGHAIVDEGEERRRVIPAIRALHAALPEIPISVDTRKPAVAAAALGAGAALVNDVAAVSDPSAALFRLLARRARPLGLLDERPAPRDRTRVAAAGA